MTICSDDLDGKPLTSKRVIALVRNTDTPMHDVRNLMLELLKHYQEADKIGFSLGVLNKPSSFSDAISWRSILCKSDHAKENMDEASKEHLVKSVDHLEELVGTFNEQVVMQIRRIRDQWMRKVFLWDLVVFGVLIFAIVAGLQFSGMKLNTGTFVEIIQSRPLFSVLTATAIVALSLRLHFFIRRAVINNILGKIQDNLPQGMSLKNALVLNTRIRHSIFRPDPVGWNFIQRKHLAVLSEKLPELRERLTVLLANYSETKEEKDARVPETEALSAENPEKAVQ